MNSSKPGVVKSRFRYAARFSSVDSTPIASNRFVIVPVDSSAARMPLSSATIDRGGRRTAPAPPSAASFRSQLLSLSDGW